MGKSILNTFSYREVGAIATIYVQTCSRKLEKKNVELENA